MAFLHHHAGILLMITAISTLMFQSQQVYAHPEYLLRGTAEQQHDEEASTHPRTLLDSTTLQKQLIIPQIKTDIKALIAANPALAPKFVRLTFHDCVGGCNGCVDMTNVSVPAVSTISVAAVWVLPFSSHFDSLIAHTHALIVITTCIINQKQPQRRRLRRR
jgi:hypothetical protein